MGNTESHQLKESQNKVTELQKPTNLPGIDQCQVHMDDKNMPINQQKENQKDKNKNKDRKKAPFQQQQLSKFGGGSVGVMCNPFRGCGCAGGRCGIMPGCYFRLC